MEPVFRTLEIAAKVAIRPTGTRITYHGLENIPATGGAVIAINHTSYIDFLPAALAAHTGKRRMRFMIKSEMQDVKIVNFLIKHSKTIPVDRDAGAGAYAAAVERLRAGELVGVYPEATISRSFELKEFKTGAARMARRRAGADHPDDRVGRAADVDEGPSENIGPQEDSDHRCIGPAWPSRMPTSDETSAAMRDAMNKLLHKVQQDYPHPDGAYWVPRRLGGSAPTIDGGQGARGGRARRAGAQAGRARERRAAGGHCPRSLPPMWTARCSTTTRGSPPAPAPR